MFNFLQSGREGGWMLMELLIRKIKVVFREGTRGAGDGALGSMEIE